MHERREKYNVDISDHSEFCVIIRLAYSKNPSIVIEIDHNVLLRQVQKSSSDKKEDRLGEGVVRLKNKSALFRDDDPTRCL